MRGARGTFLPIPGWRCSAGFAARHSTRASSHDPIGIEAGVRRARLARGAKLDAAYQNRTGLGDYLNFWSGMQSVTLVSVSPRDASSVVVRLRYVRLNGSSDTEDRWLSVVLVNGQMLISDSQRIGPA